MFYRVLHYYYTFLFSSFEYPSLIHKSNNILLQKHYKEYHMYITGLNFFQSDPIRLKTFECVKAPACSSGSQTLAYKSMDHLGHLNM